MVVSAALAAVMVSWIATSAARVGEGKLGKLRRDGMMVFFFFIFFFWGGKLFFFVCSLGIGKGLGIGKFLQCLQVGMVEGFPGFEIGA